MSHTTSKIFSFIMAYLVYFGKSAQPHSQVQRGKGRERGWFQPFVHALNCGGIPPLLYIIDARPTPSDVITILHCFLHTSHLKQKTWIVVSCMPFSNQQVLYSISRCFTPSTSLRWNASWVAVSRIIWKFCHSCPFSHSFSLLHDLLLDVMVSVPRSFLAFSDGMTSGLQR